MHQIISYLKYNIKMIIRDKIPMLWSILLPSVFLLMSRDNVEVELDLRFWWGYIILSSYIYGIGIYALTLKESGTLKTSFSICNNSFFFFFGNLFTQIIYSSTCILCFNILVFFLYKFSIMKLLLYSMLMIILLIPIAFMGFAITLLKNVHINSLSTITNILFMILFFMLSINSEYRYLNPLYYFSNVIMFRSLVEICRYCIISILMLLIGNISIKVFSNTI